jgi:hypothetical protein
VDDFDDEQWLSVRVFFCPFKPSSLSTILFPQPSACYRRLTQPLTFHSLPAKRRTMLFYYPQTEVILTQDLWQPQHYLWQPQHSLSEGSEPFLITDPLLGCYCDNLSGAFPLLRSSSMVFNRAWSGLWPASILHNEIKRGLTSSSTTKFLKRGPTLFSSHLQQSFGGPLPSTLMCNDLLQACSDTMLNF